MTDAERKNSGQRNDVATNGPTKGHYVTFQEIAEISPECRGAWHYLGWTSESPVQAMAELQSLMNERSSTDLVQQYLIIVRTFEAIRVSPSDERVSGGSTPPDEADDSLLPTSEAATISAIDPDNFALPPADLAEAAVEPVADLAFDDDVAGDDPTEALVVNSAVEAAAFDELEKLLAAEPLETDRPTAESTPESTIESVVITAAPTIARETEVERDIEQPSVAPAPAKASGAEPEEQQLLDWTRRMSTEIGQLVGRPATEPVAAAPATATPPVPTETPTKNRIILAVDDSPTVRKLVTMTLELHGYQVETAENGLDALKVLARVTPDLILLDVNMPRMDGYKLCKMIKGHAKTRDIPVVMLTGKDGMFDKLRGKFSGCDDYISKPFESAHLLAHVARYLSVAETEK